MKFLRRQRRVYEVTYSHPLAAWVLKRRSGRPIGGPYDTKAKAVAAGVTKCRRVYVRGGRAQLVVHKLDGTIDYERTYPDDTPRRKG